MVNPVKIVLVGAASREFGPATLNDIYCSDPLSDVGVDIALVDLDAEGLEVTARTRTH